MNAVFDKAGSRRWGEAISHFKSEGYCLLSGLLRPEMVDNLLQDFNGLISLQLQAQGSEPKPFSGEASLLENMEALLQRNVGGYLAAVRHAAKLISLQRLIAADAIVEFLNQLGMSLPTSPTSPILHVMSEKLKIPDGYYGVAPHQDWTSLQGGLDAITMWVPMMDVSEERFPLEIIPRSDGRGLWKGVTTTQALEISPDEYRDSDFVRIPARRGDAVVFNGFIVHRTGLAGCKGLRIASSTRYENSAEPTFIARGYPCAYRRTVQREMITPNFPSAEQVTAALKHGS